MIACYAWTDTQIINLIQTLRTAFPGQTADLYVLKLDRIPDSFLSAVEKSALFRHITLLPLGPDLHDLPVPLRLPGIKTIKLGRIYDRFYKEQIEKRGFSESYETMLVPGFWAETLHVLHALCPDRLPRIHFTEEGMYSYFRNPFRCRVDAQWKEWPERILRYGPFYFAARRRVEDIFLFRPDEMETMPGLTRRKIKAIDSASSFWQSIFTEMIPEESVRLFRERDFVFLMGALKPGYEPTPDRTEELLRCVADTAGPERVVVRLHPTLLTDGRRYGEGAGAAVDYGRYWFEGITALTDFSRKTIVARNSSVFQMILDMGSRPRALVLTYKLYDYYTKHGDRFRDTLADSLGKQVPIFVPENEERLKQIVRDLRA